MPDTVPQDTPADKPVYIYTLSSPADPKNIRYVGKTIDPVRRLAQHIRDVRLTHTGHWLAQIRAQGLRPLMALIEVTTPERWKEREVYWVAYYRAQGFDLTNSTDGGDGTDLSPEARAKISAAAKSWKRPPFSEEWRRKLGDVSRGKKQSPEHVAKKAAARRGSEHTPETRAMLSAMKKGKSLSPEHRAKIAAAYATPEVKEKQAAIHRGKTASPETRAKMSAAQQGRQVSPETRAKLAAANLGKKRPHVTPNKGKAISPEIRAKISASLTGKKLSPEAIEKRSATVRAKKHPPKP